MLFGATDAVDIQLYQSCTQNSINIAIGEVSSDLAVISDWSRRNGLLLNPGKSIAMCIGLRTCRARALLLTVMLN